MKLAITAGGTGGHILPAMAVLDALRPLQPDLEVRFFGPENRGERAQVERFGLAFEAVPSAGVRGKGPLALLRSASQLMKGVLAARSKLGAYQPDVVFSTGGYGSFPCSLAARVMRRPLVVYLPDVQPGWAVKVERRLATRIATTTEAALSFLPPKKTSVTGYPVRAAFLEQTRDEARKELAIGEAEKVLVVAGATQGAHAINEAVFRNLRTMVEDILVFHVTGEADFDDAAGFRGALGPDLEGRYHVAAFRDDLPRVMLAADLAVMRAGASTLGELPAAELPAILVPGTFAGGHQRDNANWLARAGAAEVMEESALGGLGERVLRLIEDEAGLAKMREAARRLARPQAAREIAEIIIGAARR
jgi:UDP-N-acetylglucosamine--N-acetylmuramyl-(pentapeptide) pyrophosphoryl-undecaprenol N-acetylglucosamine transferase